MLEVNHIYELFDSCNLSCKDSEDNIKLLESLFSIDVPGIKTKFIKRQNSTKSKIKEALLESLKNEDVANTIADKVTRYYIFEFIENSTILNKEEQNLGDYIENQTIALSNLQDRGIDLRNNIFPENINIFVREGFSLRSNQYVDFGVTVYYDFEIDSSDEFIKIDTCTNKSSRLTFNDAFIFAGYYIYRYINKNKTLKTFGSRWDIKSVKKPAKLKFKMISMPVFIFEEVFNTHKKIKINDIIYGED